ncbi:MAG: GTP pyrophosphokinase [marine bacterium B5-7]|nr:MAG: GTP pyrophosphokinase [marine bacterium B5-7]
MVTTTQFDYLPDGSINAEAWLNQVAAERPTTQLNLIRQACILSQLSGSQHPTFGGFSCLQRGLEIADLLLQIGADHEAMAAAVVYDAVQYADLPVEDVAEQLGDRVARLVQGTSRMETIKSISSMTPHQQSQTQFDNIRKMLLAMVDDIRVVLIKLAEQVCALRACSHLGKTEQTRLAKEISHVYAPLANRLGISEIKWEMEDLCFRYLQNTAYKKVAQLLSEKRLERERYVDELKKNLTRLMLDCHLDHASITGRPKHIYSIYKKMARKEVSIDKIYDAFAFRILVHSIEDCYTVLSKIHDTWPQIVEEFDDYIAKPKPNGYRSIHTAVTGPDNKNIEIQIRTVEMHEDSELGVAAHWQYKEGKKTDSQAAKIAWLRQVLEWQRDLAEQGATPDALDTHVFDDRLFVFTPKGDIFDLPPKATPLDFAYYIHSEVGHRCRGAKVNGRIVPLTYSLQTGEQVDILTTKDGAPSRDWLNPHLGYVTTSRAKAKIHHWFRQQDFDKNHQTGKQQLEKALQQVGLNLVDMDLAPLVKRFNFKTTEDLIAAIGCGDIKVPQTVSWIQQQIAPLLPQDDFQIKTQTSQLSGTPSKGIRVQGVGNLLTHISQCCQPVPGDDIIGFVTQGRGVSIHQQDCSNILNASTEQKERLLTVTWGENVDLHAVDITLVAYDRRDLLHDVAGTLSNEKINMTGLETQPNRSTHQVVFHITLEVPDLVALGRVLDKLRLITNMIEVSRRRENS